MKKLLLSFITATLLSSMSAGSAGAQELPCLLYTSDAADEL